MGSDIDQHLDRIEWGKQQENGDVLLSPAWEVFILATSMLSIFNLFAVWFIRNPDTEMVYIIMDLLLMVIFALDLLRRLAVAERRSAYLRRGQGWIDAIAVFPVLHIFRVFRIVRMLRIMNRLSGPVTAFKAFFSNRAAGGLLSVLFIALLVMEFGAVAVLAVERGAPGANIESAQDAIWYVIVTMSTVGYGDQYPVTSLGRLTGSIIIVVGVGVFGTLTGFLANAFLSPSGAVVSVAPPDVEDASADDEAGTRLDRD